ncbi:hypothetical protein K1T71_004129 [Dendrolimus kikuchii]|uniref:Uncharacterized protein n=1 Tax=Dendrolimus kikuchii TaxID=765133 RepID=A0ACC1DA64_9NEOP|nr:hypothetical protein K1T71_004129 [Dendrolimus kikuchii]
MSGFYFSSMVIGLLLHQIGCSYYHEPSRILLHADDYEGHNETDFGFAIEYQNSSTAKLIIGAPRYDLDGKVYTCEIEDCLKNDTVTCPSVDVNIQELANTTRNVNPNQHFYLGATIAAVRDYFLTCAPLWTSDGIGKVDAGTYGTCFIYNGTAHRYNGIIEKRIATGEDGDPSLNGYGWNVLADEVNGRILITKPVVTVDILTLSSNSPFDDTESLRTNKRIRDLLRKKYNIGHGLVAGNFFGTETTYAFSYTTVGTKEGIAFLKPKNEALIPVYYRRTHTPYTITSKMIGSMFGKSLCSADIDQDGYSELIVGAPAHIDALEDVEVGAVHIYSMMNKNEMEENFVGSILGFKEGSQFGTAIAADDLDGDKLPELFISAPYEEDTGAVYIISGAEINKIMIGSKNNIIHLPDLRYKQRIAGEGHRRFGSSIKIIPDIDENGCNELAVGSPGDSYVSLYRCIPNVRVEISASLVGPQMVSEKVNNFDVCVCVNITYQEKPSNIISKLLVTSNVIGDNALIPEPTFKIDMSEKHELVCKNITIKLMYNDPAYYKFTAKLDLHPETQNMAKSKDFKHNLAILNPFSITTRSLEISRNCKYDECEPILSMNITWFGALPYRLGSTDVENINITVHNTGHNLSGACVWIGLKGAKIGRLDCFEDEARTGYFCSMPKPLRMYKSHVVNIVLNMSRPLSTDTNLDVDAKLYKDCENRDKAEESKNLTIPYYLTVEPVLISGLSAVRNVSDKDLNNVKFETFNDTLEYMIVNYGSVTWLGLQVLITAKRHTYITDYIVSASYKDTCIRQNNTESVEFTCTFDLKPNVTKKFMVIAFLSTNKLKALFNETSVNITAEAKLSFPTLKIIKKQRVTSTIIFLKELTVGDSKLMIIIIGSLLALAVLFVIVIVLYKYNFFQRKQKKKLEELKDTWRRRAMRKRRTGETSESASQKQTNEEAIEDIEMYVVEDSFEDIPIAIRDEVQLIEERAQVHRSS